jgi:hypothetical protein
MPVVFSFLKLLTFIILQNVFVFASDPSDSPRDADVGQSSYVGGGHNMDPNVVNSSSFGILWTQGFNQNEQVS